MSTKRHLIMFLVAFALSCGFLLTTPSLIAASKEKVLYSFNNRKGIDGTYPQGPLTPDAAGHLYGTTPEGGAGGCYGGCGTVFELTRGANGQWKDKVLHIFQSGGSDGVFPNSSLAIDAGGNLYGTTYGGGGANWGIVFQLTPGSNGNWTETVLYNFQPGGGVSPEAGLIFDAAGNLYGTTAGGGSGCGGNRGCGTAFQLSPGAHGKWTEKVLHNFGGNDGGTPYAAMVFDSAGRLYGTTLEGGSSSSCGDRGCGTVFQLTPRRSGNWTEKVLHNFGNVKDGANPRSSLILDEAGNVYGAASGTVLGSGCGSQGCGTVFELTPGAHGKWSEKILYSFGDNAKDGRDPNAGVILDAAGNLYGTTAGGGSESCFGNYGCGTVFQLTPGANGKWTENVLHNFGNGKDGTSPQGSLMFDMQGNLYGTTAGGGMLDIGTVFEITP